MTTVFRPYDIVFIGMGCANALLLRSLYRHGRLQGRHICIIEPDPDQITRKTFCFWATPSEIENWNVAPIIGTSWGKCTAGESSQSLSPYDYYHVSGEKLLESTREILKACNHQWEEEHVLEGSESADRVRLQDSGSVIFGHQFFDSRPPRFDEPKGGEVLLLQSFWGWNIQTDVPHFDPNACVLMDFDTQQNNHTQFMYVLPYSENRALVECTRFGRDQLPQQEAEALLDQYIQHKYGNYVVEGQEQGIIPMCTAKRVPGVGHPNWIETGARAGNIKPSTGYSFVNSCFEAERIANKQNHTMKPGRFTFYDRLLLNILNRQPHLGKPIFLKLFQSVEMPLVVRFLREETSFQQELQILGALPLRPFLGAAMRDLFQYRMRTNWFVWGVALFQLLAIQIGWNAVSLGVLVAGLLFLGLPHGAIDHLLEAGEAETTVSPAFVIRYLLLSAVIGLIWLMNAPVGLLVFLLYSAWHFGETEYQSSQDDSGFHSMLWGLSMLGFLLGTHPIETTQILAEMNVNLPFTIRSEWGWGFLFVGFALNLARGLTPFLAGLYLIVCPFLPLINAFGLYFLFDHSFKSALQMKGRLQTDFWKLYRKAIPFTIGALILGWGFYVFDIWQTEGATGLLFILLSCLSFPHVLAMNRFYRN